MAHVEPAAGLRFPLPVTGVNVQVWDFDPTLPPEKFRHEIHLVADENVEVLIHVWDNPGKLDVQHWFDENMSGFVDADTSIGERAATKGHVAAIILEQPASTDAVSQSVAVFATTGHVYSVTCIDPVNDAAAKKLFDRVVGELEPEIDVAAVATQAPHEVKK